MRRRVDVELRWWNKATLLSLPLLLYVGVASGTFRWRHPWMTETQLMQHMLDAMLWRQFPQGK